ncbi:WD repeat-containing protein 19 [Stomoxys calcitrans]|uniref:WD repeat-containing protein 19 n=1 Tax=Stomoxys calcitrans TaxID=35570 RepID=UPI0027E273B0|nr:WD repeat-containing protein 19 [Stomoxys calcitrans]XP_013100269.2 WD repeat-containing protein 19 [Stomoxys calcitrans]XP_013100270.2 WD repeat-containing protein 19 [Stomoxys calcitrans]
MVSDKIIKLKKKPIERMSFEKVLYKYEEPHGPGDVYFIWQKAQGSLLATTGSDGTVAVFNRQGQLLERIILPGLCSGFAWDNDGEILGIITASSPTITLWNSITLQKTSVESGLRDPLSCVIWSKQEQIMAVGTARGNLAIYNHRTGKRIPVLGKHSKRISCGAWSAQNILALGSDDKTFSLSNEEGDSVRVVQLRDVPSDMYFAEMANDDRINGDNAISMIIGKRTLYLYYLPEPDAPTELGFQSRYGSLLQHKWFGDGYILLGFSNGHVVAISTHPKDIGQELWQVKNHKELLTGLAYSPALEIVASCGDDNIKIHSITNLHETEKIITVPDHTGVQMIDWSADGQLLSITTMTGSVYIYVTLLPRVYAVSAPRIAILSSLAEVSIYVYSPEKSKSIPYRQPLETEPQFLALGSYHLAAGVDKHIWFYDLGKTLGDKPEPLSERDFSQPIQDIRLNADYCAVLCPPQLILQAIVSDNPNVKDKLMQTFPNAVPILNDAVITCFGLTQEYLIFATDIGHLLYFSLEKWEVCTTYRHNMGIIKMFPDCEGTKLIFIDDHSQGYVFLPALEEAVIIADFPKKCDLCLWDLAQSNHFITYNDKIATTNVFVRHSVYGKYTIKAGETKLNASQIPLMLCDGEMVLHIDGGQYGTQTLATHLVLPGASQNSNLKNLLQLRKYTEAFKVCEKINLNGSWIEFAQQAISDLEPTLALRAYRQVGDASMVRVLEDIRYMEDINLLTGFCCMLLEKYEEAKEFFLKGSYTKEALDICRDMLQWEQALLLAHKYESEEVPFIAREYAQQLEFSGNYIDALYNYEKGYKEDLIDNTELQQLINSSPEYEEHVRLCKMGIARTSIRAGDFRRGIQYAVELNDKQLLFDCAELLSTVGHTTEAAGLYERGEYYDEACSRYISLKMWNKISQILPNVKSKKLHLLYAKAKESDGQFEEAIGSYRMAGDLEACVRIYLDHLSDPHSASEIVLESRSSESAKLLAKFYQKIGDIDQALQFLVLCGCVQEAFSLAQRHNKLKRHGELLERYENGKSSDYLALAHYFEGEKYTLLAGKYYFLAREFTKALRFLLKASAFTNDESQALSMAIDCVATSNNEQLSTQLIEFLLGEVDGSPKDPRYLFRLYMARRHYKDAAKTAVIIANQEQLSGNYKSARDLLFSMYQELRRNNLSVTAEMRHNLILLHRYSLVRVHVKLGNHLLAAKLLVQVAGNISQFPLHVIPIITSTVIECHRSGLKKSAFIYASMLMRPEYRNNLDPRYSKKIESIVRKAPKGVKNLRDEIDDETMECPICDANLPNMEVTCYSCKTTLPICIATGQHIIKHHMTSCPSCDFPCFRAEMENILSELNECPMCEENVAPEKLLDVEDIRPYILSSS